MVNYSFQQHVDRKAEVAYMVTAQVQEFVLVIQDILEISVKFVKLILVVYMVIVMTHHFNVNVLMVTVDFFAMNLFAVKDVILNA